MSKPRIAIDVDDVLSQSAVGFVAYSNKRWGTNLRPEDYDDHWAVMWKIGFEEAEQRALDYHDANVVQDFLIHDDSLEVLKKLKKDFELIITTSRRISIEASTREWLDRHYPGVFSEVVFAGIYVDGDVKEERWLASKADIYKKYKIDYVVDDQLKHCLGAVEQGIPALLFGDYGWNKADAPLPELVTRVADWQAVGGYFEMIGHG